MKTFVQRAFATRVLVSLVLSATIGVAYADDEKGYRTGTMVASQQNECRGVPACLSTTSPAVVVPMAGRKAERLACPISHPNLWAWDAAQHEHIQVQLVASDRSTVTIEGVNTAKVAGMFVVSLGCSTEPYTGSGFHISRHLAPTAGLRARPASSILRPGVSPVTSDDPCVTFNVPACQSQKQITFYVGPWESTTKSYQCKAPYPYAWSFTWAQSGSPSVSALGGVAAVNPGTTNILLTNWNPFYTDLVEVNVACSQNNSFGGSCGAPQRDPGCPIVANSQKNHCNTGPVPVCFQNYEERCAPNNQLYRCTIDLGVSWCSPCPG